MKLLVLGATGDTGRHLVDQAIERGHEVVALVRNPAAFDREHDRLHVVAGDATDESALGAAMDGVDAVLSALGARSIMRVDIYSKSGAAMLRALRTHGVRRLVCITSGGFDPEDPSLGFFHRRIFTPVVAGRVFADMARLEQLLREADWCEWTVVRPGGKLTDGKLTKRYLVNPRFVPREGHGYIARADVAHFMLDEVEQPRFVRGTPTIVT